MPKSIIVNEDVIEHHRCIRRHRERIERFERSGLDVAGLRAELAIMEVQMIDIMHHRELLARSVA